jgi:hypothetical protein
MARLVAQIMLDGFPAEARRRKLDVIALSGEEVEAVDLAGKAIAPPT